MSNYYRIYQILDAAYNKAPKQDRGRILEAMVQMYDLLDEDEQDKVEGPTQEPPECGTEGIGY